MITGNFEELNTAITAYKTRFERRAAPKEGDEKTKELRRFAKQIMDLLDDKMEDIRSRAAKIGKRPTIEQSDRSRVEEMENFLTLLTYFEEGSPFNVLELPKREGVPQVKIEFARELQKTIRFYALAVEYHPHPNLEIWAQEAERLQRIKEKIGQTPVLNGTVAPPASEYWVTKATEDRWKSTPYYEPTRGAKGDDSISFVATDGGGASRKHLFADERQAEKASSADIALLEEGMTEEHIMTFTQGRRVPPREVVLDHFFPSDSIIERQKEVVEAMNIVPAYAAAQQALAKDKGFFLFEDEQYVGTEYFYKVYHNWPGNLLLMSGQNNSEKSNHDGLAYFESQEPTYQKVVTEVRSHLNRRTIVPEVHGQPVAAYLRNWFNENRPSVRVAGRDADLMLQLVLQEATKIDAIENPTEKLIAQKHLFYIMVLLKVLLKENIRSSRLEDASAATAGTEENFRQDAADVMEVMGDALLWEELLPSRPESPINYHDVDELTERKKFFLRAFQDQLQAEGVNFPAFIERCKAREKFYRQAAKEEAMAFQGPASFTATPPALSHPAADSFRGTTERGRPLSRESSNVDVKKARITNPAGPEDAGSSYSDGASDSASSGASLGLV